MKVTAIETIRLEEFPNLLWVQVHSDQGLTGLGETYFGPGAVEAHIHDFVAPYLLGRDPRAVERHAPRLLGYVGKGGSGAEMRAASAIDIALWDLWGQATGQSICQLLGGPSRESVRVYNTCAGTQYVRNTAAVKTDDFGLSAAPQDGLYEDLDAFLHRPVELAQSLLEMGITAMKIWPFDFAAEASGGQYISDRDLAEAIEPFARIRDALGGKMEVMAELHALWDLPSAKRIAGALDPFDLLWIEDPVKMDHLGSLAEVAAVTHTPIATGETLGGKAQYRNLLELEAVGVAIMDLVWGGGLTEARKVAALCEAWHLPFAAHDCTGPVALTASVHLALAAPNVFIQEIVRAFYYGWYGDLVTALPPLEDGRIRAPEGAGLGTRLNPDVVQRPDARLRRSA
ncbi:MAG: mandelate racemase/muconate lactonizing enzyme family protein [Proteobacteria bacterium]|nr:mandelate racemase/muconate lactonizing enzyme family protein [Pseudomonadota bacterium]